MTARSQNVLLFLAPKRKELRAAVSRIVRSIQLEHDETDDETAKNLGVSASTVRNARNGSCDLSALTIAAIGKRYGPDELLPYTKLFNARAVPLECEVAINAIPALASLLAKLAEAKASRGGMIGHSALAAMRHELGAAQNVINNLRAQAEKVGVIA